MKKNGSRSDHLPKIHYEFQNYVAWGDLFLEYSWILKRLISSRNIYEQDAIIPTPLLIWTDHIGEYFLRTGNIWAYEAHGPENKNEHPVKSYIG